MKKITETFIIAIILLCVFTWPTTFCFANEKYHFLTENFPPLNFSEKGEIKGPSVDIVKLIIKRLDFDADISSHPWARSYKTAKTMPYHAVFSTSRIPGRENLFKWVGPLSEKKFCFYSNVDFEHQINGLYDIRKFIIGVQRGSAAYSLLESLKFKHLEMVDEPQQNLRKLFLDRIDLWFVSNVAMLETIKTANISQNKLNEVFVYKVLQQFIAFNINTPDKVISAWQSELHKIVISKEYHSFFEKYGNLQLVPVSYRK